MSSIWIASYLLLWALVLVLTVICVFTIRQVGQLHIRLGPGGAHTIDLGPEIGDRAIEVEENDVRGRRIKLGGKTNKPTLLLFVRPKCTACRELIPSLKTFILRERSNIDTVLISTDDHQGKNRSFVKEHGLDEISYVVSHEIAARYHVTSSPFGLTVDEEGVVRSKGLVNNILHVESLVNAIESDRPVMDSVFDTDGPEESAVSRL